MSSKHIHLHSHSNSHTHDHLHDHNQDERDGIEDTENVTEEEHQATVIATFMTYTLRALKINQGRRQNFYGLPFHHQKLIGDHYSKLLDQVDDCIRQNGNILETMVSVDAFGQSPSEPAYYAKAPSDSDFGRVNATLRQMVRDWSSEGAAEREASYGPIIKALENSFPNSSSRKHISVLVPGAGLGRLPWEISLRGFNAQGNDYSLFMIIASNYIINHSHHDNPLTIYPYANSFSNHYYAKDIIRPYYIPDVSPHKIVEEDAGVFSFSAGDFLDAYNTVENKKLWDCVTTCFFLDTAKNICAYLETIYHVLKPGGLWINLGPSLWHYEYENSIDLPLHDVIELAKKLGFTIEHQETTQSSYASDPTSLLQHTYTCQLWVAKKPPN